MQQIFISYSRQDSVFVRKLAEDLEKAGYDVWWDVSDLRGGDDWVRVIPAAIESSNFVIVVLSPNAAISEWVEKEYTQALGLRKKIIPIMLTKTFVPFALNTINYVNFSSGAYEDNFKSLLTALGYTGEPPVVLPVAATSSLSVMVRRYAIPITVVGVALILLLLALTDATEPIPSPTPTLVPLTPLPTFSPLPASPTISASATLTASPTTSSTETASPTPTITRTPLPTPTFRLLLEMCIRNLDVYNIYVRSGPSQKYAPLGELLPVRDPSGAFKNVCLWFSARNENEDGLWFLVSTGQTDPALRQYEGGWILSDLLGPSPIELPLVTLTATLMPSDTPTVIPTFTHTATETATHTPSATATDTPAPNETSTP